MKNKQKHPKIMLVGRTNVGKSTIFNRIATDTQSIVLHQEGVTRDYISQDLTYNNKQFELIDTGGVSFKKQKDELLELVRQKVLNLLNQASILLFVCDGKNGLTEEDMQIAQILRKTKKPIFLLINKSDNTKALEEHLPEFYKLGIKEIFQVSAIHGTNIPELLTEIAKFLPKQENEIVQEEPSYKIAILGKPNVGKSSLMNLLIKKERSIVHETAGTTREAIAENIYFSQDLIQLIDTAGVRRKSRINDTLEDLMVKSSLAAVRDSDIVILVMDASQEKISDQELKLLFYAYEQHKAIIIVFNKTDLLSEYDRKAFEYNIKEYDFILKKVPLVWTSCKNKKNIEKIYKRLEEVISACSQKFDNFEIDELIKNFFIKKPMYHKTILLKVLNLKQIKAKIPTFQLTVNFPEWFKETQLGFIENTLRKNYNLKGCPVKFIMKKA